MRKAKVYRQEVSKVNRGMNRKRNKIAKLAAERDQLKVLAESYRVKLSNALEAMMEAKPHIGRGYDGGDSIFAVKRIEEAVSKIKKSIKESSKALESVSEGEG